MPTPSSRRGAARVSAVWTIVAFILFFVALGFAYVASDDAAKLRQDLAAATSAQQEAEALVQTNLTSRNEVSGVLGFRGDSTTIPSNLEAANEALTNAKAAFPDSSGVKTFQEMLPIAQSAYTAALGEVATLRARITELEAQLAQAREATNQVASEKDARISALSSQLSDLETNTRSEITNLEKNVTSLTDERNRLDAQIKERASELAGVEQQLAEARASYTSYVRNATREKNDIQKNAQRPDGEITAVSQRLGRAWINLGAGDRLSEGIVFRVTGNSPDDVKGFVRVVDVQPSRAEVAIESLTDTFVSLVTGDKIWNDLYEAKGRRYAVLAGRFDGAWNEKELRILLEEIGIVVQPTMDINTDFLIAGSAVFQDEDDDGEQEIVQVSDMPVYKDALSRGLTILSIRDVEQYFRK